jgi:hypothetical protein
VTGLLLGARPSAAEKVLAKRERHGWEFLPWGVLAGALIAWGAALPTLSGAAV